MDRQYKQAYLINTERSGYAALLPISINDIELLDGFWSARLALNRSKTLPFQHQFLESTGRLDNIRRAARQLVQDFRGLVYDESDVYKWLEAAFWSLGQVPEQGLLTRVDGIVKNLRAAQRTDGYLSTYFVGDAAGQRWGNLKDQHELYCAGHLIQAGIAGRRALGDARLYEVAIRFADHICSTFGPGKVEGAGGHPGIEMALVELYRETGVSRYLEQASYFLSVRGHGSLGGQEYYLDHMPFQRLERLTGHAVRALYLCAGATDIYLETGDPRLFETLKRLWVHMTSRQMFISGGVGARARGESFGADFELPNREAYAESCAAVANILWNWRMLQSSGEAKYADLIETILYNGMLAGISADGTKFFYNNPLASEGGLGRSAWFTTACCPPNLTRALAALPGIVFSRSAEGVWVHQYISTRAVIRDIRGEDVSLTTKTDYPWNGHIKISVGRSGRFELNLRIPQWAGEGASLKVNHTKLAEAPKPGSYCGLRRDWVKGDEVELNIPMNTRFISSHPAVEGNLGRVALMRGPLLYCLEQVDNPGVNPYSLKIFPQSESVSQVPRRFLGGGVVLEGEAVEEFANGAWERALYREKVGRGLGQRRPVRWTAIPYYFWANRGEGWMQVWVPAVEG